MWLINTTTLELHEFIHAEHSPPYAILSHCWGPGELSFRDFRKKRNLTGAGFDKIRDCCTFTSRIPHEQESWDDRANAPAGRKHVGIEWVWIDTVCIDKRSSAELSEAINSMYHWYSHSLVCLAYLNDVILEDTGGGESATLDDVEAQLRRSRWFTRGWTLQELIAPAQVVFVDRDWRVIGTKNRQFADQRRLTGFGPLTSILSSTTQVPVEVLNGITKNDLTLYSVAQRMSWAAHRHTTRTEDLAYCLLGIFGINMPLLYGEGRNAFRRLQEELVHGASDSIFAWQPRQNVSTGRLHPAGMLSRSPSAFRDSGNVVDVGVSPGWFLSRKGPGFQLEIQDPTSSPAVFKHQDGTHFLVRLQCSRTNRELDRLEPCVMILQLTDCGHLQRAFDAGIFTEYDISSPGDYEPQTDVGVLYVHATHQDYLQCKGRSSRYAHRQSLDWPLNAVPLGSRS